MVNSWALEEAPSFPDAVVPPPNVAVPAEALRTLAEAMKRHRVLILTPMRGLQVGDNYRRKVDELRVRCREQVMPLGTVPSVYDSDHAALALSKTIHPELTDDAESGFPGLLVDERHLPVSRDRLFRMFVEKTQAEWLLWWDDDVWCDNPHVALSSMLITAIAHDIHVLGAMYPRKQYNVGRIIEAAKRGEPNPMRFGFTLDDMRILRTQDYQGINSPSPWVLPVKGVGMGFMLVSRIAAVALTERYRNENAWNDRILGGRTVGLHRDLNDPFEAYGEDYAFCIRAISGGFPVYAYMGPEAPFYHDGQHTFAADPKTMMTLPTIEDMQGKKI